MNKGTLYLIPTPIGEQDPMSVMPLGNRHIICDLDYFIVENIRSARRFLSKVKIERSIDSLQFAELNEHTQRQDVEQMIQPLLAGRSAGIISEAGVPAVADPGADIVALAHKNDIRVVPLVGPTSIILALMASGMNGQSFAFNGYLPVKSPDRERAIKFFEKRAKTEGQSQIFIEAPYRNKKLLSDLIVNCSGETMLTVAADILEPSQFIKTKSIREWKNISEDINKRPAIFIIGATN